jgi:hypothetical protein
LLSASPSFWVRSFIATGARVFFFEDGGRNV